MRKSWSNIHFEIVFLFEILQNTVLKTVWEQGVQGVSEARTAQMNFMFLFLILGWRFWDTWVKYFPGRAVKGILAWK